MVYTHLLDEKDVAVIWRLLNVFSRVQFPYLDDKLFLWAHSEDSQVRRVAIESLSQNKDNRVHALAMYKIQNSKMIGADSGSIGLFVNNYEHDDAKLITDALNRIRPAKEDAHSIGWDIIDMSKKYQDPGLGEALKWSYGKTPCSSCRYRVVEQLDSLGQFKDNILYECQFDGNRDIVELARKKIS